jgi:hypothetical protein
MFLTILKIFFSFSEMLEKSKTPDIMFLQKINRLLLKYWAIHGVP